MRSVSRRAFAYTAVKPRVLVALKTIECRLLCALLERQLNVKWICRLIAFVDLSELQSRHAIKYVSACRLCIAKVQS